MNRFYLKSVTAILLIIGLLLPSLASAVLVDDRLEQQLQQWSETSKQNTQDSQQQLKQRWQEIDQNSDDCKPGQAGAGLSTGLRQVISRGIQQTLSQTISRVVGQNLQNIVQRQIGQVLPQVIERGLSQQLPNLMRQKMQAAGGQATPEMMRQAVSQLLPQIIQRDLPSALQNGISGSLRNNLSGELQKQLLLRTDTGTSITYSSPLLENDQIFQNSLKMLFDSAGPLVQTLNSIPDLIFQVIRNDIEEGTQPSLQQFQAVGQAISSQLLDQVTTSVAQLASNIGRLVQLGIANDAANGLAKSDGVDRLVQKMMPVIMQMVLRGDPRNAGSTGVLGQMNSTNFSAAVNQASGSFNNFNFNDFAGNNITAAIGFDMRPVAEAIAQPLALATVSGLGVSGYDNAIGNLATIGFQGTPTIADLRLASQLTPLGANYLAALPDNVPFNSAVKDAVNAGDINNAFTGQPSPIATPTLPTANEMITPGALDAFNAAHPDFVGPVAASDIIGRDASAAVNGGVIANNISGNLGQSLSGLGGQIGGALQTGLINGISGGIGGLVDGIPYVGGLLSPIAEQMVQIALIAALGPVGAFISGVPVHDPNLQDVKKTITATGKATIKALGKPLGKIQGFEQQQVKQNDKMLTEQQKQEIIAINDCMKNKAAKEAARAMQHRVDVDNPATRDESLRIVAEKGAEYQEMAQTAATSPLGDGSGNGVSTIADPQRDQAAAAKAGMLIGANQLGQGNDPDMQAISQTLTRLALMGQAPVPTMSLTERQAFQNATNLSGEDYFRQRQNYWGKNDPMSLRLDSFLYADELANVQQAAERDKFLAYSSRSKEQCRGTPVTIPGAGEVCPDGLVTTVPGSAYTARANAFATADIAAGVNTHFYKENEPLGPFFQTTNQWFTGGAGQYGGYGGLPLTIDIDAAFNQGLNTAVENGLNNAFGQLDNQLSSLPGRLQNGFSNFDSSGGSFTAGNCDFACNQDLYGIIDGSLGGIDRSQYPNLLNILLQILVKLINDAGGQP